MNMLSNKNNNLESFISMLKEAKIDYDLIEDTIEVTVGHTLHTGYRENGEEVQLQMPVLKNKKETRLRVDGGYVGFYTNIIFDENGKLKSIEAYE